MNYKICMAIFSFLFTTLSPLSLQGMTADYVIVGLGTSGAVLAKMLSDDKKTSVIALHNGPNLRSDPEIKLSKNAISTASDALAGPPFFINGLSTPQPQADNREVLWALGIPAGGASSVNVGTYCIGTNQLYARWENIAGPLWSVERISYIYKKLESFHGRTPNPAFRGYHGPVEVRQVPHPTKIAKIFSKAVKKATGLPYVLDYNDPETPIGVSPQVQYTQKGRNGALRVSSVTAFLHKKVINAAGLGVKFRRLRVLFESTALKIIWEGNKAVGVSYLHGGKRKRVNANKGVIICAGLFSSSFLMHSGVGPAPLLKELNIPVIFDNPHVGQGLCDQPHVLATFTNNPKDLPSHNINSPFDQISWLPDPDGNPKRREIRFATISEIPGFTVGFVDLLQPKSRGTITINSADPLSPPIINEGLLSDPQDLELFQKAFQVYIKAINQSLQEQNPEYRLVSPDPKILDDDALTRAFIKANVSSNESFQSHCRMAPLNKGGVVNSEGRVYGVQNLIVADDSIVPLCMDGSTMASAYLIAVNIAQILLENQK